MPHEERGCGCQQRTDGTVQYGGDFHGYFVPERWELEYPSLDHPGKEWSFYLTGHCQYCRRAMKYRLILQLAGTWKDLLSEIYSMLIRARPFGGVDFDASTYSRTVLDRARWYQQQDDLTPEQRASLFVSLFRDSDRLQVRRWLERERPELPYTHPKRDRKSELFNAILDRARVAGDLIDIDQILDYCLPNKEEPESPDRDQYLTDYRFNIIPHLQFGSCEGIYLDLLLEGSFDATDRTRLPIGTIKTLGEDQEACELMGRLCGLLMFHGNAYVNDNLHRYTPLKELEREYARILEKRKHHEGGSTT